MIRRWVPRNRGLAAPAAPSTQSQPTGAPSVAPIGSPLCAPIDAEVTGAAAFLTEGWASLGLAPAKQLVLRDVDDRKEKISSGLGHYENKYCSWPFREGVGASRIPRTQEAMIRGTRPKGMTFRILVDKCRRAGPCASGFRSGINPLHLPGTHFSGVKRRPCTVPKG